VEEDARALWEEDQAAAIALFRRVNAKLNAPEDMFCAVAPYGRFFVPWDSAAVRHLLYSFESAHGDFAAALAVAEECLDALECPQYISWKRECLDRLGDRETAIEYLLANLEKDDSEGTLRECLARLTAS